MDFSTDAYLQNRSSLHPHLPPHQPHILWIILCYCHHFQQEAGSQHSFFPQPFQYSELLFPLNSLVHSVISMNSHSPSHATVRDATPSHCSKSWTFSQLISISIHLHIQFIVLSSVLHSGESKHRSVNCIEECLLLVFRGDLELPVSC